METSNFFDTGQRNRFPVPEDMFNLNLPDSDGFLVDVKRGIMFFCVSQQITLGKLREFFTEKAIELFEHDGYITIRKISKIQQILTSGEIKKVYAEYVEKSFTEDTKFDATEVIREYLEKNGVEIVNIERYRYEHGQDTYGMTVKEGGNTIGAKVSFQPNF
jgi:hypothetical protein